MIGIMWSCSSGITDYPKTVLKLEKKYRNKGYEILESSGECSNKNNHYLLLRKDDVVFLDRVIKGEAVQAIYPSEEGVSFITTEIYFDKGIKIKNKNMGSTSEFLSAEFQSWRKTDNILCFRSKYNDDFSIIYHIGRNEALVLYGEPVNFTGEYFCQTQHFTFADLYDDDYFDIFISPSDYSFSIEKRFSYDDLSVIGFSDVRIEKEDFPWMILQRKLGGKTTSIKESGSCIYIPTSWIGSPQMDMVADCIEDAWYEEEERVWQEEEAARIQNNAIDYDKMLKDFRHNSVKAKNTYSVGDDMILELKINRLLASSKDGYAYRLEHDCSLIDLLPTTIYTNDESFVQLDYPQTVIITANSINHSLYEFKDAILWFYSK